MSEAKKVSRQDVKELFDGIRAYVAQAKEICAKGDYLELEGLDDQVKTLCEGVMHMPVEDSMTIKDDLQTMMAELDELQTLFEKSKDKLAHDMRGVEKHKQASLAYKQSETAPQREGMTRSSNPDDAE